MRIVEGSIGSRTVTPLLSHIYDMLHDSAWVAAFALLIQGIILIVQAFILNTHATTMERYTGIAKTQADTAKSIQDALDRMEERQVRFQERTEIKSERDKAFDTVLQLSARVRILSEWLARYQVSNFANEHSRQRVNEAWESFGEAILPCQTALATARHLSSEERNYFMEYATTASKLVQNLDPRKDIESVTAFQAQYKDCGDQVLKAASATSSFQSDLLRELSARSEVPPASPK